MLKAFQNRVKDDKGFTLIELMVVVLIIGILLAIAIPTFLRVRRSAQDKAAQSSVQDAIKAEKAHYVDNNAYTANVADNGDLDLIEPSLRYFSTGGAGTCTAFADGPKCVRIELTSEGAGFTNNEVTVVALSESGVYWAMRDVASGDAAGTFYGQGAAAPGNAGVTGSEWT